MGEGGKEDKINGNLEDSLNRSWLYFQIEPVHGQFDMLISWKYQDEYLINLFEGLNLILVKNYSFNPLIYLVSYQLFVTEWIKFVCEKIRQIQLKSCKPPIRQF